MKEFKIFVSILTMTDATLAMTVVAFSDDAHSIVRFGFLSVVLWIQCIHTKLDE